MLSASGSPKIRLEQETVPHRNRRTWMRRWTAQPCEGRSVSRRSYRLWIYDDRRPHSGLAASAAVGLATISRRSGSVVTVSTRRPAGDIIWNELRRMAALSNRARRTYPTCTESESEPLFNADRYLDLAGNEQIIVEKGADDGVPSAVEDRADLARYGVADTEVRDRSIMIGKRRSPGDTILNDAKIGEAGIRLQNVIERLKGHSLIRPSRRLATRPTPMRQTEPPLPAL